MEIAKELYNTREEKVRRIGSCLYSFIPRLQPSRARILSGLAGPVQSRAGREGWNPIMLAESNDLGSRTVDFYRLRGRNLEILVFLRSSDGDWDGSISEIIQLILAGIQFRVLSTLIGAESINREIERAKEGVENSDCKLTDLSGVQAVRGDDLDQCAEGLAH